MHADPALIKQLKHYLEPRAALSINNEGLADSGASIPARTYPYSGSRFLFLGYVGFLAVLCGVLEFAYAGLGVLTLVIACFWTGVLSLNRKNLFFLGPYLIVTRQYLPLPASIVHLTELDEVRILQSPVGALFKLQQMQWTTAHGRRSLLIPALTPAEMTAIAQPMSEHLLCVEDRIGRTQLIQRLLKTYVVSLSTLLCGFFCAWSIPELAAILLGFYLGCGLAIAPNLHVLLILKRLITNHRLEAAIAFVLILAFWPVFGFLILDEIVDVDDN